MQLHSWARPASGLARIVETLVAVLRHLAFGLVGLFLMGFTLLVGLAAAGVLLVTALVARRRLRCGELRFAWRSGMGRRCGPVPWRRGPAAGRGEVVEAEVREIRD